MGCRGSSTTCWTGDGAIPGRVLRPVTGADIDGFHALASKPGVYRFLFDGVAPDRAFVAELLDRALDDAATAGPNPAVGMWALEPAGAAAGDGLSGLVHLKPAGPGAVELSYLLDPPLWGRGLGLAMAWAAVGIAFRDPAVERVLAGADGENAASIRLLRRLGMRFRGTVDYPLGPGVEFELGRDDRGPDPPPAAITVRDR